MDINDDIFYDLDPLFEGDEWNHRKVSKDQILCMNNQNEEEKSTENDDKIMTIQEILCGSRNMICKT
ncbi:hypothetical protein H5410_034367 [Solanum commersonii]|uniref:Uncharacterized protein n=1 Tax=Solanum commersonii TaxID=4109 RepID=A0A9J5YT31_SOLCO|nr:hypothetical protein H5410_034367 [Solanum commersonii]